MTLSTLGLVALTFARLSWRLWRLFSAPPFRLGDNLRALTFDLFLFGFIAECLSNLPGAAK